MAHFLSQCCLDRWVKLQARPRSHVCSYLRQLKCSKANKTHCGSEIKITISKPNVGVLRFTLMLNKYSKVIGCTSTRLLAAWKSPQTLYSFPYVAVMEQVTGEIGCCPSFRSEVVCVCMCVCVILVWLFLFALHILLNIQAKHLSSTTSGFLYFGRVWFSL